jgi:hypothetical protein
LEEVRLAAWPERNTRLVRCGAWALGKLFVVPAWALPVPVSDRHIKGLYKAEIARFSPVSAVLSSASTGLNRQHNCYPSALLGSWWRRTGGVERVDTPAQLSQPRRGREEPGVLTNLNCYP